MAIAISQHTNEERNTIAEMEKKLEEREDAYKTSVERKFYAQLSQEREKFDDKVKELKKRYNKSDYGVLCFIFTISLIFVIIYRHFNYNKIESELKIKYPYIYDKINQINYDIDSYNTFEFALIITTYHYIVYKLISKRFTVMFLCGICCIYMWFQSNN